MAYNTIGPLYETLGCKSYSFARLLPDAVVHGSRSPADHVIVCDAGAPAGDRYDGKWEEGLQDGVGEFAFANGSIYNGFWSRGVKDGVGMYAFPITVTTSSARLLLL